MPFLAEWDTQQIGLWGLLILGLAAILLSLLYRPPGGDPKSAPPDQLARKANDGVPQRAPAPSQEGKHDG
jgi:hypothetical protein